jgi:predicted dehydrogenase
MSYSRRDFLYTGSLAALGARIAFPGFARAAQGRPVAASDTVRFGLIGAGVRGSQHLQYSLQVPGVECVAVSDLWDARHQAAREYLKKDVPVTRDYRALLDRKDVDAVIVAATDHQHRRIVEDACAAGKDVCCEKPLSHTVEEGFAMVAAAQKHQRVVQAGAQRVSSVVFAKAKEIYDSGRLGKVYAIEAWTDRNSPGGAWIYPIPPGVTESAIDWKEFLVGAPARSFDPVRFFRWRCFTDYGEGLAGDLFVHLISGIMFVTGVNSPPVRAQSTGGIFRWKDGRDYPDLLETLYDYPDFRVAIRCNQNNDAGEKTIFYGTKGTLTIAGGTITFVPQNTQPQPDTYATIGWPKEMRDEYMAEWKLKHPETPVLKTAMQGEGDSFTVPRGYDDTLAHQANFFASVRSRKPPVEDVVFGNHAAISCHMANFSYFKKEVAVWDEAGKRIRA